MKTGDNSNLRKSKTYIWNCKKNYVKNWLKSQSFQTAASEGSKVSKMKTGDNSNFRNSKTNIWNCKKKYVKNWLKSQNCQTPASLGSKV